MSNKTKRIWPRPMAWFWAAWSSVKRWLDHLIHLTVQTEELADRVDGLERVTAELEFALNETRSKVGLTALTTVSTKESANERS